MQNEMQSQNSASARRSSTTRTGCVFAFVIFSLLIVFATVYPSCTRFTPEMEMQVRRYAYKCMYLQIDDRRGYSGHSYSNTNWLGDDLLYVLIKDDVRELARRIDNGLSPNSEFFSSGSCPEELGLPLLFFALDCKAKRCASLLLERGASVTRPDAFNKIAIQWAEETGMPTIADKIERANKDLGILAGLEITNAILRLCPPGSIVIPPTDVPLVVVCEDEKDFGREKRKYAEAIPWPKHYSVLGVSTNGPYPTFEYEIQANGVRKVFGGMLSRHRGYYVITNSWINDP